MTILPQLEHDLAQAAEQRLPPDPASVTSDQQPRSADQRTGVRRRLAATASAVPVLVAIAVALIIAAVALTLGHDRRQQPGPAAITPPANTVQTTRRQLIGMLGVLRRPQTKADLDPELVPGFITPLKHQLARLGYPELDRPLVRVVRIPAWQAKVGIEPATWRPSPASRHRSEGVDLSLWIGRKRSIPPSSEIGTGPRPTSVAAVRDHGLALADPSPSKTLLDGVVLVPDDVAKITLRSIRLMKTPVRVDPSRFGSATATVHDNIAAFQLTLPTVVSHRVSWTGLFGTSATAQTTWYDASGHVIKHTTTSVPVVIRVAH